MSRHLRSCQSRLETIEEGVGTGLRGEDWIHFQVADQNAGQHYWLHLDVDASEPLMLLDRYLRAIWLECCGHMSEFVAGRPWRGVEIPMEEKIGRVFEAEQELTHVYDFGTSSYTKVRRVDRRKEKAVGEHPIVLMARNDPPEMWCVECGKSAEKLCLECVYEGEGDGTLCADHVSVHTHEEYGPPVPVVNSPRLGLCGYTGPAEAPF